MMQTPGADVLKIKKYSSPTRHDNTARMPANASIKRADPHLLVEERLERGVQQAVPLEKLPVLCMGLRVRYLSAR